MENRRVNLFNSAYSVILLNAFHCRETNLDDVLQINNVFMNVSKGEVAKHGDLQKAFGKIELSDVVKEVCGALHSCSGLKNSDLFLHIDPQERRSSGRREGARSRSWIATEGNRDPRCREMR